MTAWLEELSRAARAIWRTKQFAAAAIGTLAVGITGATVMFALVSGVLLEPLPVREQDRLIVAWKRLPMEPAGRGAFGATSVRAVRDHATLLESVAPVAYNGAMEFVAVEDGAASVIRAAAVGGDFFRVLGTDPIHGRTLHAPDDVSGAERTMVIGEGLWRRRYASAADAIGRRLLISEQPFVIVGVVPDVDLPRGAEAWMSLEAFKTTIATDAFRVAATRDHDLIARMRPDVTLEQAASEVQAIAAEFERTNPEVFPRGAVPVVQPYEATVVGDVRTPMLVLFAAVALVLLIAGANVANLMLLRGEARRAELAVRTALGADRGRLVIQLLAEAVLLGVSAAAVALLVAWWSLEAVIALSPTELPRLSGVGIDLRVALFATFVGVVSAALAGSVASFGASRIQLVSELRAGGSRTAGRSSRQGRRALVVTQVALSLIVVAAAGVLTRTLMTLQALDMGIAADRLVFVELSLPASEYPVGQRRPLFEQLMSELRGTAGIDAIAPLGTRPYAGLSGWNVPRFIAEGQGEEAASANPALNLEAIHPEHFTTMDIALVRGRAVQNTDVRDAPLVTIVSADVAQRVWPNEDPIGKRIKMGGAAGGAPWFTVVGIAEPVRYRELQEPAATMYVAAAQFIDAASHLALRTSSSLDVIAPTVRERVRSVDPDVHVLRIEPFSTFLARPLARPRFVAWLTNIFGSAALLLAAVGLYGVLAAYVRQSSREIGVRMALGATARHIRALVWGEATTLIAIGLALGTAAAVGTSGLLRGMAYGVEPADPGTILLAIAVLIFTTAAACYLPVRRATRVNAVTLLRAD